MFSYVAGGKILEDCVWGFYYPSPDMMHITSTHVSLARTSLVASPNYRGLENIGEHVEYLVSVIVSATRR